MVRQRALLVCLASVYLASLPAQTVLNGDTAAGPLRDRAEMLYSLMQRDPSLALQLARPAARQRELRPALGNPADVVEIYGAWTGPVTGVVEDDIRHSRGLTRWFMRLGEERIELFFAGEAPGLTCDTELRVEGLRLRDRMVATAAVPANPAAAAGCSTVGPQKSLVILANYPGAAVPEGVTPQFLQNVFFGPGKSVDRFWHEVSYGKASVTGTVVGPVTLDAAYTCDQTDAIQTAAIQAADGLTDLTQYSRIFVVFPPSGACNWAGRGSIGCWELRSPSRGAFQASIAWLNSEDMFNLDVAVALAAHEGGHNLGLAHATSLDFGAAPLGLPGSSGVLSEYGDLFSGMGVASLFGHYNAPQKLQLGWLEGAQNVQTVQTNGTFALAPLERPSAGLQAIRVRRGLTDNRWLWLESRQPGSAEECAWDPSTYSGALVHYEDPADLLNSGKTKLLNFGGAEHSFATAALAAGATWRDPGGNLSLRVNSAGASGVSVAVSYIGAVFAAPAAPEFLWRQGAADPQPQTIALTTSGQRFNYTAAAVSSGNWLVLATPSGAVPGAVSIVVNPTGMPAGVYTGTLTLTVPGAANPQLEIPVTLTVLPHADAPQAVSVTPSAGSGGGQRFSFLFTDPVSAANLQDTEIDIHDVPGAASSCHLRFDSQAGTLALENDAGTAWETGTLENSQCVVSAAASSASIAGSSLTLVVAVSFKPAFAGAKNVFLRTRNAAWSTGWQRRGTWTADFSAVPLAVTPAASSGSGGVFSFLYADPKGVANFGWVYGTIGSAGGFGGGCGFQYDVPGNALYLTTETGGRGATLIPGGLGTAENANCVIAGAGSSVLREGEQLTLNLNIGFKAAFAGRQNIYMLTSLAWRQTGEWTVVPAQAPARLPEEPLSYTR